MLSSIAADSVWVRVTWEGTAEKISFRNKLDGILVLITSITTDTVGVLPDHCSNKIKTFLRHSHERLQRKDAKAAKQSTSS